MGKVEAERDQFHIEKMALLATLKDIQLHLRIGSSIRADGELCTRIDTLVAQAIASEKRAA